MEVDVFDANQLGVAAIWSDGFVKPRQQNYFGLYWNQVGKGLENSLLEPNPLTFQLSEQGTWQAFEPAAKSDPNTGTRFDGYQIGKASVRLHYRLLVGGKRITVSEDIRVEGRGREWQGYVSAFRFTGLPSGAKASFGVSLDIGDKPGDPRTVSQPAKEGEPLLFRVDQWIYRGADAADYTVGS